MEEIEVPTEHLQEEIHHRAQHESTGWFSAVALSSALLAALAAVSALLSGHHANEAMVEQMRASDHWSYYQAKSIKESILTTKQDLLLAQGKALNEKDKEKLSKYASDEQEIMDEAKADEQKSTQHFSIHEILARAVTFFQIAIAVGAISVLTRKRWFFYVSIAAGLAGLVFLIQGF